MTIDPDLLHIIDPTFVGMNSGTNRNMLSLKNKNKVGFGRSF